MKNRGFPGDHNRRASQRYNGAGVKEYLAASGGKSNDRSPSY